MQLCTELFSSFKVEDKISVGNLELFPINASLLRQPENTKSFPELMEAEAAIITEMRNMVMLSWHMSGTYQISTYLLLMKNHLSVPSRIALRKNL